MSEPLPLPPPQSEEEIIADAKRLLGANRAMGDVVSFLEQELSKLCSVIGFSIGN